MQIIVVRLFCWRWIDDQKPSFSGGRPLVHPSTKEFWQAIFRPKHVSFRLVTHLDWRPDKKYNHSRVRKIAENYIYREHSVATTNPNDAEY